MANTKISQLPSFAGSPSGSVIIANNSGSTETFQVRREEFIDSGIINCSWTTNYFNLTNGVVNYPRWDTTNFNTNTNIFELISGSAAGSASRVWIKESGVYQLTSQVHMFDFFGNQDFTVSFQSASSANGAMGLVTLLNDYRTAETSTDQILNGTIFFQVPTAPIYITIGMNPSANTPFPSSTDSTPTRIFVKKLAI